MSTAAAAPMPATTTAPEMIPTKAIKPSPTNPRKHFDKAKLDELTASVRKHGILTAILVRPDGPSGYELVAGERRWRASKAAGLERVPAQIRELSDAEVIELQLAENLDRADLHPLEEAQAYHNLTRPSVGYSLEKIAERVGRAVGYVRDRIKLLSLIKAAQELFQDEKITLGHAHVLARLSPADQERVIDMDNAALWEQEQLSLTPAQEDANAGYEDQLKPKSVRELESWVNDNIRLDVAHPELPDLFPSTHEAIARAEVASEKVIHITYESQGRAKSEDGERIYADFQWRRADKVCAAAVTGVVVIGPGRGDAFRVCVDSKNCHIHWPQEVAARKKIAKADASGDAAASKSARDREEERRAKQQQKEEAGRKNWKASVPVILAALAEAVKKLPVGATGPIGELLCDNFEDYNSAAAAKLLPRGRTAEDLVRHLALRVIVRTASNDYWGPRQIPALAKKLGVDFGKVMKEATQPKVTAAASGSAEKRTNSKKTAARGKR